MKVKTFGDLIAKALHSHAPIDPHRACDAPWATMSFDAHETLRQAQQSNRIRDM